MVEQAEAPVCNVCDKPLDAVAVDVQLGPVCLRCKTRLRWADFWLTKVGTGIDDCTNKYHYRLKSTNDKGK